MGLSKILLLLLEWVSEHPYWTLGFLRIDMIQACRLPGDVNSASSLWKMLEEQRAGQCDVPSTRFNIDGFYQPEGGMNMRGGYFIKEDIRNFDNEFFGILNQEATYMDPQQRKLLEVVFECFETAGITLDQISGSDTGCYVGNFGNVRISQDLSFPSKQYSLGFSNRNSPILIASCPTPCIQR